MKHSLTILVALLAPTAAVAQQPNTTTPDVVTLAFAWPVGMRASIDLERSRVRSAEGRADSSALRVAYDLDVASHPDGRLIRYSNFSAPGIAGLSDAQQRLVQAASSIVPSYVVSGDGELLQIHQVGALRSDLTAWLREAIEAPLNEDLEALMSQMLSEQTLLALATEQWNALVGTWVEAELEVGAAYEMEAEEPLPMLGNALVPYRYELGVSARVPCNPGGTELDCVELILRSYPDPEALQPHLEAFIQKMVKTAGAGGTAPTLSYKQLDIENEIVVVAEPASLIPHALTMTRTVQAVIQVGDVEQSGGDRQVAHHVFTYR